MPSLRRLRSLLQLVWTVSSLLPSTAGCAGAPALRARALPQLQVNLRRTFAPGSLVISAHASFPFSGRPAATPPEALLDELPWSVQDNVVNDGTWETMGAVDDAPLRDPWSAAAGGPRRAQGAAPEPAVQVLWVADASTCARVDTCAWERLRVARLLSAWGAGS